MQTTNVLNEINKFSFSLRYYQCKRKTAFGVSSTIFLLVLWIIKANTSQRHWSHKKSSSIPDRKHKTRLSSLQFGCYFLFFLPVQSRWYHAVKISTIMPFLLVLVKEEWFFVKFLGNFAYFSGCLHDYTSNLICLSHVLPLCITEQKCLFPPPFIHFRSSSSVYYIYFPCTLSLTADNHIHVFMMLIKGGCLYPNGQMQEFLYIFKWQSSKDETGRTYYYNVNGSKTSWELPTFDDINSVNHPVQVRNSVWNSWLPPVLFEVKCCNDGQTLQNFSPILANGKRKNMLFHVYMRILWDLRKAPEVCFLAFEMSHNIPKILIAIYKHGKLFYISFKQI